MCVFLYNRVEFVASSVAGPPYYLRDSPRLSKSSAFFRKTLQPLIFIIGGFIPWSYTFKSRVIPCRLIQPFFISIRLRVKVLMIFDFNHNFSLLECFFWQFLRSFTNYLRFKLLSVAVCGGFLLAQLLSVAICWSFRREFLLALLLFVIVCCNCCVGCVFLQWFSCGNIVLLQSLYREPLFKLLLVCIDWVWFWLTLF